MRLPTFYGVFLIPNWGKILKQIQDNPHITMSDIAKRTGYSRSWVAETMKRLQAMTLIKRIGSDKTGYWEILVEV